MKDENKKYCIDCAHDKHKFEIVKATNILVNYVYIDGIKFISRHRAPSHKVKCSDCGVKTTKVFERYCKRPN